MDEPAGQELLEALDGLERRSYSGVVYRHYAPAYGVLSGEGARLLGGRWNPPNSFATLYTAGDVTTVDAEFERQLARSALGHVLPRDLATIRLELTRVVDLRDERVRVAIGIDLNDIVADDPTATRRLGQAAHHLGYEAIISPSATGGEGHVVAIFLDRRSAESSIDVLEVRAYDYAEKTVAERADRPASGDRLSGG